MRGITRAVVVLTVWMSAAAVQVMGQAAPSTSGPLNVRVTIDYRNRPALEVLQTLTRAAGMTLDVATGELLPVTTAMTNVRLETALTAVCENASCRWTLHDRAIVVIPVPVDVGAQLPPAISIALSEVPVREVFRALAAALSVELVVAGDLPDVPVTLTFRNASPASVLNVLAQIARCSWQLDPGRLIVRRLP